MIAAVQRRFLPLDLKASWVRPENVHLTLKFLGNIHPDRVSEIGHVLKTVAGEFGPFSLSFSELGMFPKSGGPRVLWMGVKDPGQTLPALHRRVQAGLESLGFEPENRPYSPHLTLARIKSPKNGRLLREQVKTKPEVEPVVFEVDRIVLFQSELTAGGSRYSKLMANPLGNSGPETKIN